MNTIPPAGEKVASLQESIHKITLLAQKRDSKRILEVLDSRFQNGQSVHRDGFVDVCSDHCVSQNDFDTALFLTNFITHNDSRAVVVTYIGRSMTTLMELTGVSNESSI